MEASDKKELENELDKTSKGKGGVDQRHQGS